MKMLKYLIYASLFIIMSCKSEIKKQSENNLESVELLYAKGFKIEQNNDYKLLTVMDPWQGASSVEYKYVLLNRDTENVHFDNDWTVIKTPVERVVCLSTTHIAFLDVLNKTNSIVAVSGTDYVNNLKVRNKIKNKEVVDIGYENSLNYELIASLKPDLVITYGVGSQVAGYNQKLKDLGINTVIIGEYLENHPLGKLEWIKFVASFFNLNDQANEYFSEVSKEYEKLSKLTDQVDYKPKVLFGLPWKDSWYVPGGNSYLAQMVKDAGGDYLWKENESRESLPFDIESMFSKGREAEVWLNTGIVNSKLDILRIDERFENFKPFINSLIYNNNNQLNQFGGNDYWEKGLVEPHMVLNDMIKILHPDLMDEHSLVYYKAIK